MVEHRRSQRKRASQTIPVSNTLTGEVVGSIVNMSIDGMMLVGNRPFREDSLYQFNFQLPPGAGVMTRPIEIGVHEQWLEPARIEGQYFVGFRIIDIAPDDHMALYAWVSAPGGQFD
jgi:hypothetical protein